jgi:hypothetical protein
MLALPGLSPARVNRLLRGDSTNLRAGGDHRDTGRGGKSMALRLYFALTLFR